MLGNITEIFGELCPLLQEGSAQVENIKELEKRMEPREQATNEQCKSRWEPGNGTSLNSRINGEFEKNMPAATGSIVVIASGRLGRIFHGVSAVRITEITGILSCS